MSNSHYVLKFKVFMSIINVVRSTFSEKCPVKSINVFNGWFSSGSILNLVAKWTVQSAKRFYGSWCWCAAIQCVEIEAKLVLKFINLMIHKQKFILLHNFLNFIAYQQFMLALPKIIMAHTSDDCRNCITPSRVMFMPSIQERSL